ncbi:MAG: AAA family ATPase [Bdellovibrionales bacterium]|nr:AAA family ATPase [Bdellovibrionales bacterium]
MQKIIFVTGKGGVGKSTYAAALAQKYANQGKKTLLVELGDQSFYQEFFSLLEVGYQPLKVAENLDIALWSGAECLKEYALYLLKSQVLYKLFFENRVSKSLIQVAPALPELAILGKITSEPRHHGPAPHNEVLVIDAYSTGHFLALLQAPKGMAEIIKFGPMGEQSRSIFQTIKNPNICEYHVVTLAEELPFVEGMELMNSIEEAVKIKPRLIFNKIVKTILSSKDLNANESGFQTYLKSILANQETYLQQSQTDGIDFLEMPLLSISKAKDLTQKLAEVL